MRLVIVHFHLRPGGVRRVLEMAAPPIMRAAGSPFSEVLVAAGELAEPRWMKFFSRAISPRPVFFRHCPSFNYFAELSRPSAMQLRQDLNGLVPKGEAAIVWAHNLAVGRNLLLLRGLTEWCRARNFKLLHHHHDWWFDNRWGRWKEFSRQGVKRIEEVDELLFPAGKAARHITINQHDFKVLRRFRRNIHWLPNPLNGRGPVAGPGARRKKLRRPVSAPLWLLPCRFLRRKNIAEAILLARWLRPEARVATTAGVSSADETPYAERLNRAARDHRWNFVMGLCGQGQSVEDLIGSSEVILLTSLMEGFGLPLIEAAAGRKPMITRNLEQVVPDLEAMGFRFPHQYGEVFVDPGLFDFRAELKRQKRLFDRWRQLIPAALRLFLETPEIFKANEKEGFPFSKLTLTAQLEVLRQPPEDSWDRSVAFNRNFSDWKNRLGRLTPSSLNAKASGLLSPKHYAVRFLKLAFRQLKAEAPSRGRITQALVREKFKTANLYPLLWAVET